MATRACQPEGTLGLLTQANRASIRAFFFSDSVLILYLHALIASKRPVFATDAAEMDDEERNQSEAQKQRTKLDCLSGRRMVSPSPPQFISPSLIPSLLSPAQNTVTHLMSRKAPSVSAHGP